MRTALAILCGGLFFVVGIQACTAYAGGAAFAADDTMDAGAVGLFLSLMLLVGAAFALGRPIISGIALSLGGLAALAMGGEHYGDLPIWGGIALALAAVSFWEHRKLTTRCSMSTEAAESEQGSSG